MSRKTRNFIIAYIFLVGLPMLGLIGILKSTRDVAAPLSDDGVWIVETDYQQATQLPCVNFPPTFSLVISQSGQELIFDLHGVPRDGRGRIEGNAIQASFLHQDEWARQVRCKDISMFTLVARVDPKAEPRTLAGTFSAIGCSTCLPVQFRAARKDSSTKGTE